MFNSKLKSLLNITLVFVFLLGIMSFDVVTPTTIELGSKKKQCAEKGNNGWRSLGTKKMGKVKSFIKNKTKFKIEEKLLKTINKKFNNFFVDPIFDKDKKYQLTTINEEFKADFDIDIVLPTSKKDNKIYLRLISKNKCIIKILLTLDRHKEKAYVNNIVEGISCLTQ